MSLPDRLVLLTAPIAVLFLVLSAGLIYRTFDQLDLERARSLASLVLSEVRETLQANVDLGLTLGRVRVAQDLIERKRAQNSEILAIDVFGADGVTRFSTDRGTIDQTVPAAWLEAARSREGGDVWTLDEQGGVLFGTIVESDYGEAVGHVAIFVAATEWEDRSRALLSSLARTLLWLLPVSVALLFAGTRLISHRATSEFVAAAAILRSGPSPRGQAEPDTSSTLCCTAANAHRSASEASIALDDAIGSARRLDDDSGGGCLG